MEVEEFIASRSRMRELQADFGIEASMANSRLLAAAMSDEKANRAELTKSKAIVLAGDPDHTGRLLPDSAAVTQWFSDNAAILDRMSGVVRRRLPVTWSPGPGRWRRTSSAPRSSPPA